MTMVEDGTGALWREVLDEIQGDISEPVIKTALNNAKLEVREAGQVVLRFPEPFMMPGGCAQA